MNSVISLKNKEKGSRRCFILACGPSLLDCSSEKLQGETLIAVNHAIKRFPNSQYSVIGDLRCYLGIGPTNNILFSSSEPQKLPNSVYSKDLGALKGWSWDLTKGVYNGHTSSYIALQFAVWLGFKEIYFVGLDLRDTPDLTHFYGKRDVKRENERQRETLQCCMSDSFVWAQDNILKDTSIKVYNCSKNSRLKVFPFVDLDEVLCRKK